MLVSPEYLKVQSKALRESCTPSPSPNCELWKCTAAIPSYFLSTLPLLGDINKYSVWLISNEDLQESKPMVLESLPRQPPAESMFKSLWRRLEKPGKTSPNDGLLSRCPPGLLTTPEGHVSLNRKMWLYMLILKGLNFQYTAGKFEHNGQETKYEERKWTLQSACVVEHFKTA